MAKSPEQLPPLNMCVRIGVSMRIFHTIAEREPSATTSTELAEMTGGDRSFIGVYTRG